MLTLYGKTQSMIEWAEELDINYSVIKIRKQSGWSDERTLLTPSRRKIKKQD
jgi:hypothetical protein